ncbi:hypothetical protein [Niveispirillum cyanobacteriorum]|nr:hypothetical protein [Niveispirillum cyanobacteriorum]GGE63520.1 hypothetical protein GCM10011317_21220 [Niveispirillum cyanobacteriorum]
MAEEGAGEVAAVAEEEVVAGEVAAAEEEVQPLRPASRHLRK